LPVGRIAFLRNNRVVNLVVQLLGRGDYKAFGQREDEEFFITLPAMFGLAVDVPVGFGFDVQEIEAVLGYEPVGQA
jgi:hypothetical protein